MDRKVPSSIMPHMRIAGAVVAILALVLAVGLAVWRVTARSAVKPVDLTSLYWIYYKEDLARLQPLNPDLIGQTLSGPGTYVLEQSAGGTMPAGAIPTQTFFSDAGLQAAIANDTVIPGVKAVLDDPENWAATPISEQQNPLPAMRQFGQDAQAGGYQALLAPGRDLTAAPGAACAQTPSQNLTQAYLACDIAAAAADAPIYVIQTAPVETNVTQLTQLVQQAATQARSANPNVIIIATLSTTSNGGAVSSAALATATRTMLPYVQGFLLNTTAATDGQMISCLQALDTGS